MNPWLALAAWSFAVMLLSFLIGKRCGRLSERDRCVKVILRGRHAHEVSANQARHVGDQKRMRAELWIYEMLVDHVYLETGESPERGRTKG